MKRPTIESFRMPNSIIQGLTTATSTKLNKLSAFEVTTLLGLMSLVDPKRPTAEVRARPSDILEIIEVGKSVEKEVSRTWQTADGRERRRPYKYRGYKPKHFQQIHAALLTLFNQTVELERRDAKRGTRLEGRVVHLLDMFGYTYQHDVRQVDLDDLADDQARVNVGTAERPVWRLRRRTADGEQDERPTGILFRLNADLAQEVLGAPGTIKFTHMARRVFSVLRHFSHNAKAMRLLLLVLRQTSDGFERKLVNCLEGLTWDPEHPARSLQELEDALRKLQELKVVTAFEVNPDQDLLRIEWNRDWYKEDVGASGEAA
jgi:hypothetical protein